jgi:hypothetical protein
MYLLNEGTIAVGAMTVAFFIAFLLVVLLGAYVVYCDAQNRAGETEFAGVGHADDHAADPVESTAAAAEPAEHHTRTRRRAHPPDNS